MTEDVSWLLPTESNLGSVDEELHVDTIVRDRQMRPLVGRVTDIGVDGGCFVGTVSFERKEEARVTVSLFTNSLDAKQPASVTGSIEAFVVQAWKEKEQRSRVFLQLFSAFDPSWEPMEQLQVKQMEV